MKECAHRMRNLRSNLEQVPMNIDDVELWLSVNYRSITTHGDIAVMKLNQWPVIQDW